MTNGEALAKAKELRDVIIAHRHETEGQRQLPNAIIEGLIGNKLCLMALPKSYGGLELSPVDQLAVLEELAAAEAAVAWIVWNNSLPCWFARYLRPEVCQEIFANRSWMYASSTRPAGRAVADSKDYKLNGRWSLVSGCMHAEWIPVAGFVEENGQIQMLGPGIPNMRMFFVPRASFEIIDTWNVGGLRGTGSHDVVLKDERVPDGWSFSFMDPRFIDSPHGRIPIVVTMGAGCASMCLGIAQRALSALIELGRNKVSPDPGPDFRDRPHNQALIARLTTTLEALKANLVRRYAELWAKAEDEKEITPTDLGSAWAAAVTAATQSRKAVAEIYAAAGTSALYVDNPIERAHRDIDAVLQHVAVQPFWLEEAGKAALGLEPTHPLFAL